MSGKRVAKLVRRAKRKEKKRKSPTEFALRWSREAIQVVLDRYGITEEERLAAPPGTPFGEFLARRLGISNEEAFAELGNAAEELVTKFVDPVMGWDKPP